MLDNLDKLMNAGIGALSMTREKAEKLFDEYVERGKTEKTNKPKFVQDMMDQAEKSRKDLEDLIDKQVHKTIERMNLATKDDIKRIEDKLDIILAKKSE